MIMKKFITLLLAVIMVAAILASCTTDPAETTPAPDNNDTSSTPSQGGDDNETPAESDPPVVPGSEDLNLDLEALDYGGEAVYFYTWATGNPEFTVDEEATDGDPINESIYKRNLYIEEQLGVTLNFHSEAGADTEQQAWIDTIKLRVEDPETPVDIIAAYSRTAPYVLINGFAVDLETYNDDLDLDKAWWPSLVKDEHMIRGRLFYVSGDISPGLLLMMQALFLNKTMFKSLGNDYDAFMKDITESVENSKWTLDKMIEICAPAYIDNDGVAGSSEGDTFGYVGSQVTSGDSFWQTTGYKLFQYSDKEGEVYVISDELAGEPAANFVNKMKEWNQTDACWIYQDSGGWTMPQLNEHFGASKALFIPSRFLYFEPENIEIDYAILPFPKFDAKQERFYTCVGNPYSLYSISPTSRDLDRAAQVIQVMGYKGYNETTPAIFETMFKGQYSKDDYSIDACNVVREAITFDVGRTFDRITNTMLPNFVSGPIARNEAWNFSAVVRKSFNAKIKNVNTQILEVLESIQ